MAATRRWLSLALAAAAVGCAGNGNQGGAGAPATGGSEVAARIDGQTLTLDDVDAKAKLINAQAYQALYDARKKALEQLISERLLEREAAARGITREALMEQEVNAKVQHPTAEQVRTFFDQNQPSMRGQPFEQASPAIRNHLASQSRQRALGGLLSSLHAKYGVEVSLAPPRVPVTVAANDPRKGPDRAPVRILEFSDFQ